MNMLQLLLLLQQTEATLAVASLAAVALTNLWGNEDQVQNYAAGRAYGEQVESRPPEANGAQLTNKNETHQRK